MSDKISKVYTTRLQGWKPKEFEFRIKSFKQVINQFLTVILRPKLNTKLFRILKNYFWKTKATNEGWQFYLFIFFTSKCIIVINCACPGLQIFKRVCESPRRFDALKPTQVFNIDRTFHSSLESGSMCIFLTLSLLRRIFIMIVNIFLALAWFLIKSNHIVCCSKHDK